MSNDEIIQQVLGTDAQKNIDKISDSSPELAKLIKEHAYEDIYGRGSLSLKMKELAAVACLVGSGDNGLPIKAHFKGMLNVGWSLSEIKDLLVFLTIYIGYPKIINALFSLEEIEQETTMANLQQNHQETGL